jgi:hypothetical protein
MNATLSFMEELRVQRWDDHRFYHHSRINQSLHLISACCFLVSYALLAFDVATAVWIGWVAAFVSRQIGHFFFEPKEYDAVNDMSHEQKEAVKVGYNLFRKYVLCVLFLGAPLVLWRAPTLFGLIRPYTEVGSFGGDLSAIWLALAGGALLFRTLQLFYLRDVQTGLVWLTKILTDPFNDVRTYWKAPYYLVVRRQLLDPSLRHGSHA